MASLSVRKLDDQVYEKLRLRAAQHGVSMEEEARQILSLAVKTPHSVLEVFQKYFGSKNGIDLVIPSRGEPHEPMRFDE